MNKDNENKTVRREREYLKKLINLSVDYPEGKIPKTVIHTLRFDPKIINLLFEQGFIVMGYDEKLDHSKNIHQARNFFFITEKGRTFSYWLAEDRKTFILKSVVVPMFVSFVTAAFTVWLKTLF